jgi:hypothetical protein
MEGAHENDHDPRSTGSHRGGGTRDRHPAGRGGGECPTSGSFASPDQDHRSRPHDRQGGRGDNKTPPAPAGALPNETYVGGSSTVAVGSSTALLTHINNAHINNAHISRTPMC